MADTLTILDEQLLSNDIGLNLRIFSIGPARFGSTRRIAGGVLYTAPEDGTTDQFTYTIRDRYGNLSSATVTVNILEPTIVIARDNVLSDPIDCGTSITLTHDDLLTNDTGETPLKVTAVANAVNGTVTMDDTTVTFTADPCGVLSVRKTFVAPRRSARSTLDANGVVQTFGLFRDETNVAPFEPGHFAVLSMIRLGASVLEPGWTPLAESAQAKLFYRMLDASYVEQHKSALYTGTEAIPYPYLETIAPDAQGLPQLRVETFAVPEGVEPTIDDLFLMTYADTKEGGDSLWRWEPTGFSEDYYRRVYVDAFGPTGVLGGGTSSPSSDFATTSLSVEDSLNRRKSVIDGNRLTYDISGDTFGRLHAFGGNSFSEGGTLSDTSNVYTLAYALRSQPREKVATQGGFTYTATDENGSYDTAQVVTPVLKSINTTFSRFRQAEISINGDGIVGLPGALEPNNFRIGVHCKSYENQYVTNSSLDRPLDPEPGWTTLNKTLPNDYVAGTIAYQRFVPQDPPSNVDAREVQAFRYMGGLPPTSSMTGLEVVADPGEEWEDIYVSSQAFAMTRAASDEPYVCPKLDIPEGCCSVTVMTARSYTALVDVSGGDSVVRISNRYDFLGMTTWIVQSTTVAPNIVVRRHPSSTRATLDVGTFTIVFRNRK